MSALTQWQINCRLSFNATPNFQQSTLHLLDCIVPLSQIVIENSVRHLDLVALAPIENRYNSQSQIIFQDYITIYDGYTTRDPIILKFCGGGQSLPASISSGPELLVEFTTSPYGTFVGTSSQVTPLYGFLLEVSISNLDFVKTYVKIQSIIQFGSNPHLA